MSNQVRLSWIGKILYSDFMHIRGAFNKFPDFFLKKFKIVVDS